MSNANVYINFTKAREGGLSKAKTDPASAYPVPDGSGYHTNKGITWRAFEKIVPGATPKRFYDMTDEDFNIVFNHYWKESGANLIDSQVIANLVFQALWGGGHSNLIKSIQGFLKLPQSGNLGPFTEARINSYPDELKLHDFVFNARLKYLRSLNAYKANGKGWEARMRKLYDFNLTLIK